MLDQTVERREANAYNRVRFVALTTGTRLGLFEVTGRLGAGGMGEVYRARDSRLGRDVALKILPEPFAGDADRVSRFEREARILACLTHPRIATLYGLEESSAPDGRWVAYQSNEPGRVEIYVQAFPGPGSRTPVSAGGGAQVRWNRNGRELLYAVASDGQRFLMNIIPDDNPTPFDRTRQLEKWAMMIGDL